MTSEPTRRTWPDELLERYLDEDLEEVEMVALADELRRSVSLRERLARRSEENTLIRTALEIEEGQGEPAARAAGARTFVLIATLTGAAAAALAMAFAWSNGGGADALDQAPEMIVQTNEASPALSESDAGSAPAQRPSAIRVMFALERPKPDPHHEAPQVGESITATPKITPATVDRLDRALASGDVDAALDSLRAAPDNASREAGFGRLATILRSAETSERVLDKLPPAEQVAVCRLWAEDPRMRPVSFSRLQQLSTDPTVSSAVNETLEHLYDNRSLRPWMRSYGLADARGPRPSPVG